MVIERENLLDENGLPKKALKLQNLPFLMMKKSMNYMKAADRIRLAALSDEMEDHVKTTKAQIAKVIVVRLEENCAFILAICEEDTARVVITEPPENFEGVTRREIALWCDDGKSIVENTISVLLKIQGLFEDPSRVILYLDVAERNILKILLHPELKQSKFLYVENDNLGVETIDKILEITEGHLFLGFQFLTFPLDYYHENAFNSESVFYHNAGWVRTEQLLALRDKGFINLEETVLDWSDLEEILSFWCTAKHDMFLRFKIIIRDEIRSFGDRYSKLGALRVIGCKEVKKIFGDEPFGDMYMIMAKTTHKDKKHKMAVLRVDYDLMEMYTVHTSIFKEYVEIMEMINLKKEKTVALRIMEENVQFEQDWIQRMGNRQVLTAQEMELQRQLEALGVQFVDGQPRLIKGEEEEEVAEQPEVAEEAVEAV